MNAREKLNGWTVAGVLVVAYLVGNTFGSALLFWLILAGGIWWAVNERSIR